MSSFFVTFVCGASALFLLFINVDAQVLCGTRPALENARFARIFNGETAQYGEVPWQINLYENEIRKCGATIIHRSWVLTAAHCVIASAINPNARKVYRLVAGDHSTSRPDTKEQVRFAARVVIHPDFGMQTLENDIAMLETDRPFEFNDYVVPACLPRFDEDPYPYTSCTISGWGFVDPRTKPDILQTLKVPILLQSQCEGMHHSASDIAAEFTPTMLCAGYLDGSKDSCQGDSGGPLTCPRYGKPANAEKVLSGIVSWGRGCGKKGHAGIYTRIGPHMAWINQSLSLPPVINNDACKFSGVKIEDKNQGTITSPGFDEGEYPNDSNCLWEIDLSYVTSPNSKAVIQFEKFDLEPPPTKDDCKYDYTQIYSGEGFGKLLGTYCGGNLPAVLTVARNGGEKLIIKVVFRSDNTVTKQGFVMKYNTT